MTDETLNDHDTRTPDEIEEQARTDRATCLPDEDNEEVLDDYEWKPKVFKLKTPIEYKSHQGPTTLTEVRFDKEPTAKDLQVMDNSKRGVKASQLLVARCSDLPISVLEKIPARDMVRIQNWLLGFLGLSEETLGG